jgi:hypothetical protein
VTPWSSEDKLFRNFSRQTFFLAGDSFRKEFSELLVQTAILLQIYFGWMRTEVTVNRQFEFRDVEGCV